MSEAHVELLNVANVLMGTYVGLMILGATLDWIADRRKKKNAHL